MNEMAAKRLAKKFQIPQWYTRYEDLVKDDSIELVDICTPPQVRLEVIQLAAEEGKHILVEKPLATSLYEAIKIYEAVKKHDVKLNVVQNYRYFPSVDKVKERVSRGYLGNIISIQGSALTLHPADSTKSTWLYHYGGVLYDFTPHLIDMLLWINDSPVEKVFAFGGDITGGNMGFINHAQILLEFKNKSVAVADVSWLTAILGVRFTINIHGAGGHILFDVRNDNFTEFHGMQTPLDELNNSLKKVMKFAKGAITGSYFKGAAAFHRTLIMDFVDSIKKNTEPPVPVEQGVMVNAVLEAAKESIIQNKPIHIKNLFSSMKDYESLTEQLYRKSHRSKSFGRRH